MGNDGDLYEAVLYVSRAENGMCHKVFDPNDGRLFEYSYHQAGVLETMRAAYVAEFYEAFFTDQSSEGEAQFAYNSDGSLSTVFAKPADEEPITCFQFEYKNGFRVKMTDDMTGIYRGTAHYVRDGNGRVATVSASGDEENVNYSITCNAGGTTTVTRIID